MVHFQEAFDIYSLSTPFSEAYLEDGAGGARPLFFAITCCFFCDHFEELQTVLIQVKLIVNHLLFGRQLLCYSNTTSTVDRNLTVLSSTTDKINHISNHF